MNFKEYTNQFYSILNQIVCFKNNDEVKDTNIFFNEIINTLKELKNNNGSIYLIGNGGSSGLISHASIDFINACKLKAFPITDNSLLTCMANDYGYENVFKQPLNTFLNNKDLLIAVSSSGKSLNIINAVKLAKEKKSKVITLSGFNKENPLRSLGDYNFWVDSKSYGYVEIAHSFILHFISDTFNNFKYMNF
jgi:D-sedoheptulose 7-phosphate isomerase